MSNNNLILKSVNQLLELKFYVPSYQRGYRWSPTQVEQLLNDIWEFSKEKNKGNEFYCLQPIVVKKREESWELIDGQQRLTTIRIILSFLVAEHLKRPLKEAFNKNVFDIFYKTRPTSTSFLENIKEDKSNIDYYYIWKAYQKINDWFANKDYNERNKFIATLLAKEDDENPVKVIWYEIQDDSEPIDIFTRLNIGKIPLTNSELIKALFLGNLNTTNSANKINHKQLQIASEWDYIENNLQNSSFWHFIYDSQNKYLPQQEYDTRIEYIFDLMKNKEEGHEKYHTFYKFLLDDFNNTKTKDGKPDIETIWLEIKTYFLTFEEWYSDRELYHMIGYLISTGSNIKEIIKKSRKKLKSDFKDYLVKKIAKSVNFDIEVLDYKKNKHKADIHKILLLFNIQTLLNNKKSRSRFPFDSYKKGEWDIEHVRSQAEVELKGKDRVKWSKLVLEFYTGIEVIEDSQNHKEQKNEIEKLSVREKEICNELLKIIYDKTIFEKPNGFDFLEFYNKVSNVFKEKDPPVSNGISNLTLLDAGTNRAYKNAFFPIKRMVIMNKEKEGTFVPICTKNVFMKAYSRRFDKIMHWNKTDADDYMTVLKKVLKKYQLKED